MPAVGTGLVDANLAELAAAVGGTSFARGRAYAREGRVLDLSWDRRSGVLSATVVGKGRMYETSAFFAVVGRATVFLEGDCTCPVGYNCKHVAAVAVAASVTAAAPASCAGAGVAKPAEPWEAALRGLLGEPSGAAAGVPLGIEVSLEAGAKPAQGASAPRLLGRLMRPGAKGGWVNGSLAWSGLDSWQVAEGGYRADHLSLARELYALYRAAPGDRRGRYVYAGYATDKTIDLAVCGSTLWSLLDDAARLGVPLLHAHAALGELAPPAAGEIVVDVTRGVRDRGDGGDRVVRARLSLEHDSASAGDSATAGDDASAGDGAEAQRGGGRLEPVAFLGAAGHGVVCAEPPGGDASRRGLRLVRLARPAPAPLRRMVLSGEAVVVPAAGVERFAAELCPGLQRVAAVVSSDGSFDPPEVSPPSLVLRARHHAGQTVELGWEWAYQVGGSTVRVPLGAPHSQAAVRDPAAEEALVGSLRLDECGLDHLGLLGAAGRPAPGATVVSGVEAMRFITEVAPRLATVAGIVVEVEGEAPDYRDVGESVEIGVSTAAIDGQHDWFDLGVTIRAEGRVVPFAEVFVALAAGEEQLLLDDGAHFSLLDRRFEALRQLIEEARALVDAPPGELRISRYQSGLWSELAALGVVTEQAEAWRRQVEAMAGLDGFGDHEPPAALHAELRPYQREGFAWLASLWELGLGGILADDMGLGKTLQALALVCHGRARDPEAGPFLVVAPTSVVPGWVGEAARFAPSLRVEAVTDTFARSGRDAAALAGADLVVTTYTLVRLEPGVYGSLRWAGVLLDEAQAVKNHQSKLYRCVRELPAPSKVALTGTPMENNLMELWSLLSITAPGLFPDPKRFSEHYARPIERTGDAERLDRLRRRIRPLVKRRTKELVAADLPAKQEQAFEVDLHPRHRKLYDTHLQRERQRVLGLLDDFDRNRFTILRSITLLRQLSLHAGLVDERHAGVPSAKLDALAGQLAEVAGGGHRALVFSQFTSYLASVRAKLDADGIGYCYLDGRTRNRHRVLERFRGGDDPVFLISLKAGGYGLNLTEADYCFLLDPWWNPAVENQAIDRTHRIGQTRQVMVYRMIARATIEEKVVALARRKAALFSGVMDEGDLFAGALTADDIQALFA